MKSSPPSPIQTSRADSVVVLDFETTGLSPNYGDRAIEIGAVRIVQGEVTESYQKLMNPGFRISSFIESYTGISNQMLSTAPRCEEVMLEFAEFLGEDNLVAHNASFDLRFLEAEFDQVERRVKGGMACSMLAARRIYQHAPNHRLGSLVAYKNIPTDGVFHRALADAEMTARLWILMLREVERAYQLPPLSFAQMKQLTRKPKKGVADFLEKMRQ